MTKIPGEDKKIVFSINADPFTAMNDFISFYDVLDLQLLVIPLNI